MTLVLKKPANEVLKRNDNFLSFSDLIDNFFNHGIENSDYKSVTPLVNIYETKNSFKIEMTTPGIKKDEININLEKNMLTISRKSEEKKESEEVIYSKKEFNYTSFEKTFTLPKSADTEKIKAKFEEGILSIEIDKKPEAVDKPARKIEIE